MDPVARVGDAAPDLALPDPDGVIHSLASARGRIVVLNFWSAECEWSARSDPMVIAAVKAAGEKAVLWAIASNPGENPEELRAGAVRAGLPVVLLDWEQRAADAYGAAATPHVFVIDAKGVLRYSGAPDDSTFRQPVPVHTFLKDALLAVLNGVEPPTPRTMARGCAIVRPMKEGEA